MFTMFGYGRSVGWEYYRRWRMRTRLHCQVATSGALQGQRIETTKLKHNTIHNPAVCIMEQGPAMTGGAAEEAKSDEESGTEC